MHRISYAALGAVLGFCLLSAVPLTGQSAGTYHYFYVDNSQHIEQLTLLGSTYGTWQDITAINGGPRDGDG